MRNHSREVIPAVCLISTRLTILSRDYACSSPKWLRATPSHHPHELDLRTHVERMEDSLPVNSDGV